MSPSPLALPARLLGVVFLPFAAGFFLSFMFRNANAVISVNWLTPIKIRKLSITGTAGYGELDFVSQELLLYQPPSAQTYEGFTDFVDKFGQHRVQKVPVTMGEPLAIELDHFLHCVETGAAPDVGCREALAVLDIIGRASVATRPAAAIRPAAAVMPAASRRRTRTRCATPRSAARRRRCSPTTWSSVCRRAWS